MLCGLLANYTMALIDHIMNNALLLHALFTFFTLLKLLSEMLF